MVKEGKFTVEIVLADTQTAFKEHKGPDDGKTYAEVEPDAEYFIRVKNEHANGTVIESMQVDGERLGYAHRTKYGNDATRGLWSRKNGKETKKAFRFQKASVMDCAADVDGKPWTGCVEISFHEAINGTMITQGDHKSTWGGGKVGSLIGQQAKKGIKSVAGSALDIKEVAKGPQQVIRYQKGDLLGTIKLYYCTAVGLIFANVLPKPPFWQLARMLHPRGPEDDKKRRKRETNVGPNVASGSKTKTY